MRKYVALLLAVLLLAAGCGKQTSFELEGVDNAVTVTAEHAETGTIALSRITVAPGEMVYADSNFEGNGQIRIRLAEGEFSASDFPDTDTVAFIAGHGTLSFECDPGEYTVEVYCVTALTGTAEIRTVTEAAADAAMYAGVTAMERADVEAYAREVRDLYLNEDWAAISQRICYPIILDGEDINDAEAFLAAVAGKTIDPGDREIMEEETCEELFYNGEGICLGSGQLWLVDPNFMTDGEPTLQIIAVCGLVDK